MISISEIAKMLKVGRGSVHYRILKMGIKPAKVIKFGLNKVNYYSPEQVKKIIAAK